MLRFLGIVFALIVMLAPGQARADCTFPAGTPGSIVYNQTEKIFQYCADNVWKSMNPLPGTGTGGCTAPNISEGKIIYNTDHRVMQGCAGNVHRPFGKVGGVNEWKDLSAGNAHTCGIKNDGSLWCWGNGGQGQLGTGNTANQPSPTREVTGANDWHTVSIGIYHSCAIKTDGSLWCWGQDTSSVKSSPTRHASPTTDWDNLSAGGSHNCAVKKDGSLWCWGTGAQGILGTGNNSNQYNPAREITNANDWHSVSAGSSHTCAIKNDHSLWCWGRGINGQLGTVSTSETSTPTRERTNANDWRSVSAGLYHTCAVKNDDSLWCWGSNNAGELGVGNTTQQNTPTREITNANNWRDVSTKDNYTCAVKNDSSVWCWGLGGSGQLGTGNTDWHSSPMREITNANNWNKISNGGQYACAIKNDGALWCWGSIGNGQLGTGDINQKNSPARESSNATNWLSVSANNSHTCAIKNDGSLWCWGAGGQGQLGAGNTTSRSYPVRESSNATNWVSVSNGGSHACALKNNASLWCWGVGTQGQLGTGNTGQQTSPTREVSNATNWANVSAGNSYTCAVKNDGSLWCWGTGGSGRLGTGDNNQQNSPIREISNANNWSHVSAGNAHTCAVKSDGSLWCWGYNYYGGLGIGNTDQKSSPTREISNANDWNSVSTGAYHTCAIKTDSSLWCWGFGSNGQLGAGNTIDQNRPTREASNATDWINVSAKGNYTCAVKSNGSLWCWGMGSSGQLGSMMPNFMPASTICTRINDKDYKAGDMFYNVDHKTLQYCDGAGWVGLGKAQ